jgi:hypothetical protein
MVISNYFGRDQPRTFRSNKREGFSSRTLIPQTHLYFQRFEVVRDICLDFATHSLPCPLLEAVQLLVDIHIVYLGLTKRCDIIVLGVAKTSIRLVPVEEVKFTKIAGNAM